MTDTYATAEKLCDCSKCDWAVSCNFKNKYQRLPRELFLGALSLCPKIKNIRF